MKTVRLYLGDEELYLVACLLQGLINNPECPDDRKEFLQQDIESLRTLMSGDILDKFDHTMEQVGLIPDLQDQIEQNDHVMKCHEHCKCEDCTGYRMGGGLPWPDLPGA